MVQQQLSKVASIFPQVGKFRESLAYVSSKYRASLPLWLAVYLSGHQINALRCFPTRTPGTDMIELPEVIVQFLPGTADAFISDLFGKFDVQATQEGRPQRYVARLRPSEPGQVMEFANTMRQQAQVEFAEPHFQLVRPSGGSVPTRPSWPTVGTNPAGAPSDKGFRLQWGLWNPGNQPTGWTKGSDLRLLPVWGSAPSSPPPRPVRVAVLDYAVDNRHPDLAPNLEPGFNAISPGQAQDIGFGPDTEADHGTNVAGIIAAVHNGQGIAGIVPRARIISIEIATFESNGTTRTFISNAIITAAFREASRAKADLAVMSWGWMLNIPDFSADMEREIRDFGKPVFLAAGNDITDQGLTGLDYPASSDGRIENVIAVGASTFCDTIKDRTGCSPENHWRSRRPDQGPFLLAPGVSIVTTSTVKALADVASVQNYRANFGGTSAAAPMAAGVAALILQWKEHLHQSLNPAELKRLLIDKADRLPGPKDFRRVNACRAIGLEESRCGPSGT